jgi:hypothetical protein
MAETYITSKKLIQTLKISSETLIETEKFFDSIPDDEWDLVDGTDYRVVVQASGLREYTQSGAYTIARYLETTQKRSFLQKIKEMLLQTKQKIRQAFVSDHIIENCSSLMKRNEQFFISQADVVRIFKTKAPYLRKMLEVAQREEQPLMQGKDYIEILDGGGYYFSFSGISKLSAAMKTSQTKKNRKDWCSDVGEVIAPKVNDIVHQILERDKGIQKVMTSVKDKRDKKTCQVSEAKWNKVNQIKLAAHHLYSKQEYPHLADVESNLITLSCEIHDQFHVSFMGGADKPCTIDDFIQFVNAYYPEQMKVKTWLANKKLVLGDQVAQKSKNPHVLYLSASKVS